MKKITTLLCLVSYYCMMGQTFNQVKKTSAHDRASGDYYGMATAISGNYAIIGANQNTTDSVNTNSLGSAGAAYIVERNQNGAWNQKQKLSASDRFLGDQFGGAVSISGEYAVVAAQYWDVNPNIVNSNDGAVYVFKRNSNGHWFQMQKLIASDNDTSDAFGASVCIRGNYLIVGASQDEDDSLHIFSNRKSGAGSAYIFERDTINDTWIQVKKIVASDRATSDSFGFSCAITNGYAVVGAIFQDTDSLGNNILSNPGAAYVFERTQTGDWVQVKKLVANDRSAGAYFGSSVSIDNTNLLVGAYADDANFYGAAYAFNRNSGTWLQSQKLTASDKQSGDGFGRVVSVSGNYALVGAMLQDYDAQGSNMLTNAGAAYVFKLNQNNYAWSQNQKIVSADRAANDWYSGTANGAGVSGNHIVVGARYADTDSLGLNALSDPGASYFYESCLPTVDSSFVFNICAGDSALVFGQYRYTQGVYYDSLLSSGGYDSILIAKLFVKNQPAQPVFANALTAICAGASSIYSVLQDTAASSYSWYLPLGLFGESISSQINLLADTAFANYTLSVTANNSCGSSALQSISILASHPLPTITASALTICARSTLSINAVDNYSNINNYNWYTSVDTLCNGSTCGTITPVLDTTTTLYIVVTDTVGCTKMDSIAIVVNPLPIVTLSIPQNSDTVCLNGQAITLTDGSPANGIYSGAGISGNVFTPSQAGLGLHSIVYTYTDSNTCASTDTATIYVDVCTGIQSAQANDSDIIVYPNPSNGKFNLQVTTTNNTYESIKIMNALGELVFSKTITEAHMLIDLSARPQGVYTIVITGKQISMQKRVMVVQ